MKFNRTIVLLIVGLVVFEIAATIISGLSGVMGDYYVASVATAISMIRVVNIALCALLVVASLFANKLQSSFIVPITGCAIEVLLGLVIIAFSHSFLRMTNTSPEIIRFANRGINVSGFGMLIGMVFSVALGLLISKKRTILPLLIIVVVSVLSVIAYAVMLNQFMMGMTSMIAVGFLQSFTFLLPAVSFDGEGITKALKNKASAFVNKPSENSKYSYLEAYKNKHK